MKHTLQQVFRSPKFEIGFSIFMTLVLIVIIYPLVVNDPPLQIIGQGTFFPPGIYVSAYDTLGSPKYILNLPDASAKRIENKLGDEERKAIKDYLIADKIPADRIDAADTKKLMEQWVNNYDPKVRLPRMTAAEKNYYSRLNNSLKGILATEGVTIAVKNADGSLQETGSVGQADFVNGADDELGDDLLGACAE
jgi:peptide/nickel transport system permease protein